MEGFVISFPEAVAIIGSVVTVVLGLFGYLLKIRSDNPAPRKKHPHAHYLESQVQGAHDRISDLRDRVSDAEGDIKLTGTKIDAMRHAMTDYQTLYAQDHEAFDKKLDKLMDILIKILTDDKL